MLNKFNMLYKDYLKTSHWKYWRKRILKTKKKCFVCKSKDNLVVHHLKYRNLLDIRSKDLKVMCRRCHDLLHSMGGRGTICFEKDNHKHIMGEICKLIRPYL